MLQSSEIVKGWNDQDRHGLFKNQLLHNAFTRALAFRFNMNGKIAGNFGCSSFVWDLMCL